MTSHQSLYRTHRPETFADVVGQPEIVSALEAQVKSGTPAHAYLFAGSRGLGKTSLARIFARALGTSEKDVYEMDAASNNSVEDIRALTEGSYTLPFESKYKVYILDEVHMLSKNAWNAFLKTLEEPPAHVLFILATTERGKVPDTVESRCQTFVFRKPQQADLVALIERVAKKEGISLEPAAATLIATLADGSYRDALSILGKVRAACAGVGTSTTITRDAAERATGAPRHELVEGFLLGIARKDPAMALASLSRAVTEGFDMRVFSTFALHTTRTALLVRHAPTLVQDGAQMQEELVSLASPAMLATLLSAYERIGYAPVPELALELAVYELC